MPLEGKNLVAYKEDVQDEFWRFIYFFPIFMNILMLAIFYTCIKVNPIMFSVAREHKEDALYLIDKVYSEGQDRELIYRRLRTEVQEPEKIQSSAWDRMFGPRYLRGTLILFFFSTFAQ